MLTALSIGSPEQRERAFFVAVSFITAALMALGFGINVLAGLVKQPVPVLTLLHGLLFVIWIAIVISQTRLIQRNKRHLHRRLGWSSLVIVALILVLGPIVTLDSVRLDRVPAAFPVPVFLALNLVDFSVFGAFIAAAMVGRRQTDWHRRWMLGGITALLGPPVGRIGTVLELGAAVPLLILAVKILYIAAAIWADRQIRGRVHPCYYWVLAITIIGSVAVPIVASTPFIEALAQSLTARG